MTSLRATMLSVLVLAAPAARAADTIRFEVPVLPALARYGELLAYPGYLAIALENVGLSPSVSSKLIVNDRGRELRVRNGVLRYTGRKGAVYAYEAGITVNLAGARSLTFPVTIDASGVGAGRLAVTMTPPLANLLPADFTERVRVKTQLIATAASQQKALDYLDGLAKGAPKDAAGVTALFEPILLEAYDKAGGPAGTTAAHEPGDALPLSDQWLLLLTLAIWLVGPALLLVRKFRRRQSTAP
jgi:hypothetical protein